VVPPHRYLAAPMPTLSHQRSRKRVPKPHQRRALTLLAGCGVEGCTEAVMRAHGFTAQLAELMRIGFAVETTDCEVGSGQMCEVKRLKITEAGELALGYRR
jgi:hypothetical protein